MRKNKIKKHLPLFIVGDLSPKSKVEFKEALKGDKVIKEELGRIQKLIKNIAEIKAEDPRPGFETRLMKSVKSSIKAAPNPSIKPFWAIAALSATAVAVCLVAALFIFRGQDRVAEAEEWLSANIESMEAINGYADISTGMLSNGELTSFETELESLLQKEFKGAESIFSETDTYLGWNTVLESLLYEVYYENNEYQNGVL
jgi:hypothetical protein